MTLADAHKPGTFLFHGAVFADGWFAAIAVMSFQRYLNPDEFEAIQKVAEWKAARHS